MSSQIAVLIDERDNRLGRLTVTSACQVICHEDRYFVRTAKGMKLHHSHRAIAVIFEETELYHRRRLDPI